MKQTFLLSSLFLIFIVSGFGQTKKPSPFRDAIKVWNFTGNSGLKTNGAVKIGVKLEGDDKKASLLRGGDGCVADFNGGWLITEPGLKVTGKQMTLLMRVKDFNGSWKGTLLSSRSAGNPFPNIVTGSKLDLKPLGFRERAIMKDGHSIEFIWQTDPLPEQMIPLFLGDESPYKAQNFRVKSEPILKVAAPVEIIGPSEWHDILIRFTGPKLELFIDGVFVDEEFPHGEMRHFESPFLIGAGILNGVIASDFRGQIDHLAIWNRPLSDNEIEELCGGRENIAKRQIEIEGPQINVPQYWRPEGYNAFVGDPMPYYHDGTFHFFYLFDRKHHSQKWRVGGHPWGHLTSTDLTNWTEQPRALDIDEQTENALGTGSFIFHNGMYYLYWINHGRRLAYKDSPEHRLSDNIYVARSTDGIHFKKQNEPWVRIDYITGGDVNPLVWEAASGNKFYMYIMGAAGKENWYFESDDLQAWHPVKLPELDKIRGACATYFKWDDWFYWFDWSCGYRMSRTPAEDPGTNFSNVIPFGEAWLVPEIAPFTGNRMLAVGFAQSESYASMSLFREFVRNDDGTLNIKWPEEMIPSADKPIPLKIKTLRGEVSGDASSLRLNNSGRNSITASFVDHVPDNVRITMRVVPEEGASGFGLCVRGKGDFESGKELCFEPDKKLFHYALAPNGSDIPQPPGNDIPVSLANVTGLNKPFTLDVIVKDDYVDVCIDNRRTLFHWRPEDYSQGDRLFFFIRKGAVKFEVISVSPLN